MWAGVRHEKTPRAGWQSRGARRSWAGQLAARQPSTTRMRFRFTNTTLTYNTAPRQIIPVLVSLYETPCPKIWRSAAREGGNAGIFDITGVPAPVTSKTFVKRL